MAIFGDELKMHVEHGISELNKQDVRSEAYVTSVMAYTSDPLGVEPTPTVSPRKHQSYRAQKSVRETPPWSSASSRARVFWFVLRFACLCGCNYLVCCEYFVSALCVPLFPRALRAITDQAPSRGGFAIN